MVCKRVFISGKVQGVSFRFHTVEVANKLNLLGYVQNLADGRVEILVSGPTKDVEQLISWARKGPAAATVSSVEIIEIKEGFPKEPFYIRRE